MQGISQIQKVTKALATTRKSDQSSLDVYSKANLHLKGLRLALEFPTKAINVRMANSSFEIVTFSQMCPVAKFKKE